MGKFTAIKSKPGNDVAWMLQNLANEQARANELHKLELEIYLAPKEFVQIGKPTEAIQKADEKNNKQREDFQERVKNV